MNKIICATLTILLLSSCIKPTDKEQSVSSDKFVRVEGQNLIKPNGEKLFLQGINLGNWLNPEGYMFFFQESNSYRLINEAFCEMVGEEYTKWFWSEFKEHYITQQDIQYIKQTGMNSIRIPFHYKLFTTEDYMGMNSAEEGFKQIDKVVNWCKQEGLYVVLDMHDAPGGQTGDNIDDSYGYPWLMVNQTEQQKFCEIWKKIAAHYANDTTIIAYDLLNEPIAHYFMESDSWLNNQLEPLYMRCIDSIRVVDKNHIIMLGGAQWNSNFTIFKNPTAHDNIMYTCHRYWCDTTQASIQDFVAFRDSVNLPMYMGETGENTDEWIGGWTRLMERNNIGWHYWPYKKMVPKSCMLTIPTPQHWDMIVNYTKQDRSSLEKVRNARPDQELVKKTMADLLENMKHANCIINHGYIHAMGMKP